MGKIKVLLVDTYIPDNRFSMFLFARFLAQNIPNSDFDVKMISPQQERTSFVLKAFRKFFIFPAKILIHSISSDIVHICDTSHAVFLNFLPVKAIVTVHDLGGIKAAKYGRSILKSFWHNLIARGLGRATALVCVSSQSKREVDEYVSISEDRKHLILNSSYQHFPDLNYEEASQILLGVLPELNSKKYIFHLGSNEPRKNRRTVVDVLKAPRLYDDYKLVLAGFPPDGDLVNYIEQNGLSNHVLTIANPQVKLVSALYKTAEALIFPSYYEGFGIPVAESQFNGCPVICSDIAPHLEILAGTGLTANPDDAPKMAKMVLSLRDEEYRSRLVQEGKQNGERFKGERMIEDYRVFYADFWQQQK